jgi:hypothetical protein
VADDHRRHVRQRGEVAEPFEGLQEHRQAEPEPVAAGGGLDEPALVLGQAVDLRQLLGSRRALEAWVGGALDRDHRAPLWRPAWGGCGGAKHTAIGERQVPWGYSQGTIALGYQPTRSA